MSKKLIAIILAILLVFGVCGWVVGIKSIKDSKKTSYTTEGYTIDYDNETENEAKVEIKTETESTSSYRRDFNIERRKCLDVGSNNYDYITFYGDYAGVSKINAAIEEDYQSYLKNVNDLYYDDPTTDFVSIDHFNYDITIKNVYINDDIVSIYYFCDIYGGGAHGTYNYYSFSYDKTTGKKLNFREVTKDYSDTELETLLCDAVDKFFEKNPDRIHSNENEIAKEIVSGNLTSLGYCVDKFGNVSIIFNNYEIGPYLSGYFIIDVYQLNLD